MMVMTSSISVDDEDGTENMVDEIAANSHPCSSSAGRVPSDEEADEQDSDAEVHGSRQKGAMLLK